VYESVSRSDNAASIDGVAAGGGAGSRDDGSLVVRRASEVLRHGRAALITDVDGTISPIVDRPEDAYVLPAAREALLGLRDLLVLVAVVSGRSVSDARQMVNVEGLTYVGNHGLEIWSSQGAQLVPEARPWVPRIAAVLGEVARRLEADTDTASAESASDERETSVDPARGKLTGIRIENKGASASLHYRLAPDATRARRELLTILARYAVTSGLRVEEGRMVINLLPPLTVTKGSAVTWLVREHALQSVVYLGDDTTDAHAFKALGVLRQSDRIQTLGVGVLGPDSPPSVRQLADVTLSSVNAVADVLSGVLDGLRSSATMEPRAPTVGST
jgi:trehalose 6-phosphate phosphatase